MKGRASFVGNKLVTTVGEVFYTNKKIVAQFDIKKISKFVEILVVKVYKLIQEILVLWIGKSGQITASSPLGNPKYEFK